MAQTQPQAAQAGVAPDSPPPMERENSENQVSTPLKPSDPLDTELELSHLQRKALTTPIDERSQHVTVRSFASEPERQYLEATRNLRWPHIRPRSVLIAGMSFHWSPGSWERVIDMLLYSQSRGIYAALSEIQDRCHDPYDALGTMRNEAALMAQNEGFEWILYLDNDVQPEIDFLERLLAWDLPIMSPYIVEPGTGKQLFGPEMSPNTGVHPAKWVVLSMLLIRTTVFTPFAGGFWSDAIGADEGFHFQKLWHYGHRPYIDTNTQLIVAGQPHYPLSSNRLTWQERQMLWDKINQKRLRPPDRRPLSPNKTCDHLGQYMPWAKTAEYKTGTSAGSPEGTGALVGAGVSSDLDADFPGTEWRVS